MSVYICYGIRFIHTYIYIYIQLSLIYAVEQLRGFDHTGQELTDDSID